MRVHSLVLSWSTVIFPIGNRSAETMFSRENRFVDRSLPILINYLISIFENLRRREIPTGADWKQIDVRQAPHTRVRFSLPHELTGVPVVMQRIEKMSRAGKILENTGKYCGLMKCVENARKVFFFCDSPSSAKQYL